MAAVIRASIPHAMNYSTFRELMEDLAASGGTTGLDQKESLVNYTLMNARRMKRWDKRLNISNIEKEKISAMDRKVKWLVLTESWCGDAAPSLPVMNKFSEINPNIQLGILLRDEHMELMEHFKTNGTLSIPKLIAWDDDNSKVLGEWGPRPSKAAQWASEFKEENGVLTAEFKEDLQRWYNADQGKNIIEDLLGVLALE